MVRVEFPSLDKRVETGTETVNEGRRNSIGIHPIVKGFLVSHCLKRVRHLARTEYVCNLLAIPEIPRVPKDSEIMTKDHLCENEPGPVNILFLSSPSSVLESSLL